MISEAQDFAAERDAVHALLKPLADADFERSTQFKGWTLNNILSHLHAGDVSAAMTLQHPAAFAAAKAKREAARAAGQSMLDFQSASIGNLKGQELLASWLASAQKTAEAYAPADPKQRVKWAGPDMSARSSITARLMETWAHSQAMYDLLGVERQNSDRIRAIAHLGAITFKWTFANRGETPPGPAPHVRLTAPSGAIWEWNADQAPPGERIEGPAADFAQVTAQTRNIADVSLRVSGPIATAWMAKAQSFAGPPNDPPAPGARFRQSS